MNMSDLPRGWRWRWSVCPPPYKGTAYSPKRAMSSLAADKHSCSAATRTLVGAWRVGFSCSWEATCCGRIRTTPHISSPPLRAWLNLGKSSHKNYIRQHHTHTVFWWCENIHMTLSSHEFIEETLLVADTSSDSNVTKACSKMCFFIQRKHP